MQVFPDGQDFTDDEFAFIDELVEKHNQAKVSPRG